MSDIPSTSQEAFESDTYTWRRPNNEPCKKIKCFTFSTVEHKGHRKWKENDKEISKEVDLEYLQINFTDFYSGDEKDKDVYIRKILENKYKNFSGFIERLDEKYLQAFDCLFFIFLTFLTEDGRLKLCGGDMALNEIVDKVKYLLPDRPKVLLVQADDIRLLEKQITYKGPDKFDEKKVTVPTDGDIIQIVSNIPGEFARYSDQKKNSPSFLIKAFCDSMNAGREEKDKEDLLSLTVDINQRIDAEITKMIKETNKDQYPWKRAPDLEVPLVTSTLKRKLII